MKHLKTNQEWFDKLIPEGIIVPSSTIISGPGGSGKPIIGSLLVSSWLKQDGNAVVFLINNDRSYAEQLLSLFEIQQDDYKGKIFYIDLNPEIEFTQTTKEDRIQANLLKPEVWNHTLQEDIKQLENSADNLIFARTEKPMRLHIRIERMKNVSLNKQEIEVPLSEHELRNLRTEAERARKHLIPLISKI